MLAASLLLEPEHPDLFRELVVNLYDEHEPTTETERALVETIAVCRWRQVRFWSLEKAIVTQEMHHNDFLAAPSAPRQRQWTPAHPPLRGPKLPNLPSLPQNS